MHSLLVILYLIWYKILNQIKPCVKYIGIIDRNEMKRGRHEMFGGGIYFAETKDSAIHRSEH